jgi:outer membrane protein assembly factor BamB
VLLATVVLAALAAGFAGLRLLSVPPHPPTAVSVVWTFEPPQRGAFISSPAVAADRVYVAAVQDVGPLSSGAVYALDAGTGKVIWKFDGGGTMQQTYSSPCLDSGRLYLGEGMHGNHVCKFYCLDAATGRERWHVEAADHIESSPCVADGRVLFAAGDDGVYCLDAATGAERWHFRAPVHIDASPAVSGGRVYVGSGVTATRTSAGLFCLDAADGRQLWHRPTELPVWGRSVPDGDRVFVPLGNGRLLERPAPPDRPAGGLLCVDAASGQPLWYHAAGDALMVGPSVGGGRVYFGARDGSCSCLDRDGRPCWQADLGSPVVTRPALLDGRVYAVALAGPVACLDADTGKVLWKFDVAAHSQAHPQLVSSPAVVAAEGRRGRRVCFGTELKGPVSSAAVLYCLQDQAGPGR